MKSLWLNPQKKAVVVDTERFRDYPYFFDSFEQYGHMLEPEVSVCWVPIRRYLKPYDDESAEFIDEVRDRILDDTMDVPPVLLMEGELFDGHHRSWGAHYAGLKCMPVIELTAQQRKSCR